MGYGADDRGRDVSGRPSYRESDPLFGHFTRYEGLFGHNPGRPVLFDEPVVGLDEATTDRFLRYLKEYGKTYIIITHDREFLKSAVDKVYMLKDSKVISF